MIRDNTFNLYFDTHSRPLSSLTDEAWQYYFEILKTEVVPLPNGKKQKMKYKQIRIYTDDYGNYLPDERTDYILYCQFINSVLAQIRADKVAFLFFEYQIRQLLKFHQSDLRTRYVNGYWEVWLDKGE